MNKSPIFLILAFAVFLFSCEDNLTEGVLIDKNSPEYLMTLSDSCSFTVDGQFITTQRNSSGGRGTISVGNLEANRDSVTGKVSDDTVMFHNKYGFNIDYEGFIEFNFIKKYHKKDLTKKYWNTINGPEDELALYKVGEVPYAVDYERFNTRNGVSFVFRDVLPSYYTSSMHEIRNKPTGINYDCQVGSSFEITKVHALPDGKFMIEAKFEANLFTWKYNSFTGKEENREMKRLKNGYLRKRVLKADINLYN
ncbi:hypothetical protein [Rufibacter roseus]|uniref:Lipoprotein n=1 Tax=Rufibacter roseus TaxID=1567108 RepID=A0ABW2DQ96_9BACT|nr:hypothetical protein [Rufibacter roseus]